VSLLGAGVAIVLLGAVSAVLSRRHPIVAKLVFPPLVVAGCACSAIAALGALTVDRAELLSVRPLQQGRVTTYLQYMIWTLLLLLGFLLFAQGGTRP
jgi:hypothetical protein